MIYAIKTANLSEQINVLIRIFVSDVGLDTTHSSYDRRIYKMADDSFRLEQPTVVNRADLFVSHDNFSSPRINPFGEDAVSGQSMKEHYHRRSARSRSRSFDRRTRGKPYYQYWGSCNRDVCYKAGK